MSQNYQPGVLGKDSDYRLYSAELGKCLKGIERKAKEDGSVITERFLFEEAEIVLIARYGTIGGYAIKYFPGNKPEFTRLLPTKKVRRGVTPDRAIYNAKSEMIARLKGLKKLGRLKGYEENRPLEQFQSLLNVPEIPMPLPKPRIEDNISLEGLEVSVLR